MRVIAGSARGFRLDAPHGRNTRPTADRVREALFSILQSRLDLEEASVLDLCAGTGALGIEALSRGAARCCFVENDRQALTYMRKNLETTGFAPRADVLNMEILRALSVVAGKGNSYDLVFFDPPYASVLYDLVPAKLVELSLLTGDGLLVAEAAARNVLPDRLGGLVKVDRRVYGDTALELYALEGA